MYDLKVELSRQKIIFRSSWDCFEKLFQFGKNFFQRCHHFSHASILNLRVRYWFKTLSIRKNRFNFSQANILCLINCVYVDQRKLKCIQELYGAMRTFERYGILVLEVILREKHISCFNFPWNDNSHKCLSFKLIIQL